jgi:glutamate-1-semialdehyde 2,1-aminomutase
MIRVATHYADGVRAIIHRHGLPWSINQLGARAEYRFAAPYPVNGTASAAASDEALEDVIHLYLANRGILLTPFHNMALMSPVTTTDQVDTHLAVLDDAIRQISG